MFAGLPLEVASWRGTGNGRSNGRRNDYAAKRIGRHMIIGHDGHASNRAAVVSTNDASSLPAEAG